MNIWPYPTAETTDRGVILIALARILIFALSVGAFCGIIFLCSLYDWLLFLAISVLFVLMTALILLLFAGGVESEREEAESLERRTRGRS